MRRLNLSTALTVAGDATTGNISWVGLTNPTVTEVTDNPDITVNSDGSFTLGASLGDSSEVVNVHAEDAAGYWIEGPVTITGNGSGMSKLGMNLGSVYSGNGVFPFANVFWGASAFARKAGGTGDWTQRQGLITAAVSTDEFSARINDNAGLGLPSGTYTVRNPDGCEIGIGNSSGPLPAYQSYTTATSFTFSWAPSVNGMYFWVKGSLTKTAGNVVILLPSHEASWDAGDIFNSAFISFTEGHGCDPIRFMDWTNASDNIEEDWTDRTDPTSLTFYNHNANARVVPYEYIIDLANRLNVVPWICTPARATSAYMASYAALVASRLSPTLNLRHERGNEIWNGAAPWVENQHWIEYSDYTFYTGTANYATQDYTLAGHGFTNGLLVRCFATRENRDSVPYAGGTPDWHTTLGWNLYVKVIDANTFALYQDAAVTTTLVAVTANQVNVKFCKETEAGKSPNTNAKFSAKTVEDWDILDAALGVDRVTHIMPSHSANTATTSARMAVTGADRAEIIATAPYFTGVVHAVRIDVSSGQFLPKVWASFTTGKFHVAVYASGATPTLAEIIAGTGSINKQMYPADTSIYTHAAGWTNAVAVTGLSNGTSYEVYCVFFEYSVTPYVTHATITASASTSSVIINDSYANQAQRMIRNAQGTQTTTNAHIAASGGKILECYELGADMNITGPSEMTTFRDAFMESAECADAIRQCLYIRASEGGCETLCYFSDVASGPFSMADSYYDTADERYQVMLALGGRIAARPMLSVSNVTASSVDTEPGSYPFDVHTFADAALTYTILQGNNDEWFTISGGILKLANSTGLDWGDANGQTLTILASDGYTVDTFTVSVVLGSVAITDPDVIALIARYSTPPSTGVQGLLHNAIVAAKAASLWDTKFDAFYIFAHQAKADAYLNCITNAFNITEAGTVNFTAFSGVAGDGATGYLRTGFVASTAPSPKFTQNAASLGAWVLDENTDANGYVVGQTASSVSQFNPRSTTGPGLRGNMNSNVGADAYSDPTSTIGMFTLTRTASNANAAYRNKTAYGTSTRGSTGVPTTEIIFCRANAAYSTHEIAIGWIGGALTSGQKDTLYDIWQAFLAGVGAI